MASRVQRDRCRAASRRAAAVDSCSSAPGLRDGNRVVVEVGQLERRARACRRWRADSAPMRRSPFGASARELGDEPTVARRRAPRARSSSSMLEHREVLAGCVDTSASGTWCDAERPFDRHAVDDLRARSSPSACAARSRASAAWSRDAAALARASLDRAESRVTVVERRRERLVNARADRRLRRSARRSRGRRAGSRMLSSLARPSTVGPAIL